MPSKSGGSLPCQVLVDPVDNRVNLVEVGKTMNLFKSFALDVGGHIHASDGLDTLQTGFRDRIENTERLQASTNDEDLPRHQPLCQVLRVRRAFFDFYESVRHDLQAPCMIYLDLYCVPDY